MTDLWTSETDPRTLPLLRTFNMPILEGRRPRPVLMVDANVLIKDSIAIAKGTEVRKVSLAELCKASGVRVVMSERDVLLNAQGVPRIEAAIRSRVAKSNLPTELAERAIAVWQETFLPYMTILNPRGLKHTEKSLQVTSSQRDADDADLGLLGDVLGADAFASYDGKAFRDLYPVLNEKQSEHTQLFLAYRDARRFEETSLTLMAVPAVAFLGTWEVGKGVVRTLKIPANVAVVGVGMLLVAALAYPPSRAWLGRQTLEYFKHLERAFPTADQAQKIAAAKARGTVEWEEAPGVVVLAARLLIRSKASMTTTELAQELKYRGGAGTLAPQLRQHPGLFLEESRGRWVIPQGASHLQRLSTEMKTGV